MFSQGTRFDLHRLKKVNKEGCPASSYYITLLATNPDTHPQKQTFQVRVDEERFGKLDLICPIARTRGKGCDLSVHFSFLHKSSID